MLGVRSVASRNVVFSDADTVELRREPTGRLRGNEVLVRASLSLISTGTERTVLSGAFGDDTHWAPWARFPHRPGYSLVGEVTKVGRDVHEMQVGDRVAVHAAHGEYARVRASACFPIPGPVTYETACWFAIEAIARIGLGRAGELSGRTVVVVGAGIIGQLVVSVARAMGACVMVIAPSEARTAIATELGADRIMAGTAAEAVESVRGFTGGTGADLVVDATGNAEVLPHALAMARRFGRVVLVGDTGFPERQHLSSDLMMGGLTVVGAHFSHATEQEHARFAQAFFTRAAGCASPVTPPIARRVSPGDLEGSYSQLVRSSHVGIAIDWSMR